MTSLFDLVTQQVGKGIALALVALLSAAVYVIGRVVWREIRRFGCFLYSRHRTLSAVARTTTKDGTREGNGVWIAQPIEQPDDYKSNFHGAKVLAIANLKGGVGKTTLAANIGAFLSHDQRWNKRVLLIDLDFQGSLSSMVLPEDERWLPPAGQDSLASRMISGDLDAGLLVSCAKPTQHQPRLKIITAHYDLAQADNRLLIEWLLKCRNRAEKSVRRALGDLLYGKLFKRYDVRYNLADVLHSDAVREAFDLVIIDCPPRLTTGTIQALCASSHLLVPTILDRPSAEAVLRFCEQVEGLKSANICPHLKVLGAVGSKYRDGLNAENGASARIADRLREMKVGYGMLPNILFFPQTVELVRDATDGIAYFVMANNDSGKKARTAIEALSTYIAQHIGLPPDPASHTPFVSTQQVNAK
ncbi:ParA family protein [Hyphomicrobium sp. LHD-15]|uniref:ParA family protein n=1 Tax=Hyphomicrobium sp. LHD-15 TaxID=3072142 RepID=UPI00280FA757|nr:ParA family protein [Hyphomicrobium sp. LHD-15]MDQ8700117.1 ParA family protein [Hyphomicrobium sp. LHD-15]